MWSVVVSAMDIDNGAMLPLPVPFEPFIGLHTSAPRELAATLTRPMDGIAVGVKRFHVGRSIRGSKLQVGASPSDVLTVLSQVSPRNVFTASTESMDTTKVQAAVETMRRPLYS